MKLAYVLLVLGAGSIISTATALEPGEPCASSSECSSGFCMQCTHSHEFCKAPLQCAPQDYETEACTSCNIFSNRCASGWSCVDNACVPSGFSGTVVPKIAGCPCDNHFECASQLCFNSFFNSVCREKKPDKEICSRNVDCLSGRCDMFSSNQGLCVARFTPTTPTDPCSLDGQTLLSEGCLCQQDEECADERICLKGSFDSKCQDKLLVGQICSLDTNCETNQCTYNTDLEFKVCSMAVVRTNPETCQLKGEDYLHPNCFFTILVLGTWLFPILLVYWQSPTLKWRDVRWFFYLAIPAVIFEIWSALAAISAGLRCKREDETSYYNLMLDTGTVALWFWVIEIIIWAIAVLNVCRKPASTTTKKTLDERLWELIGPFMSSKCGVAFLVFFSLIIFMLLAIPFMSAKEWKNDNDTPQQSQDDEQDDLEKNDWIVLCIFLFFMVVSAVIFFWPACIWRLGCRNLFPEDDDDEDDSGVARGPTPVEIAKVRYLVVRHFLLDFGGFVVNVVALNWIAILFLVDEIYGLCFLFGAYYYHKWEKRNQKDDNDDKLTGSGDEGEDKEDPTAHCPVDPTHSNSVEDVIVSGVPTNSSVVQTTVTTEDTNVVKTTVTKVTNPDGSVTVTQVKLVSTSV